MINKDEYDRYFFVNDNLGNKEYLKYISMKLKNCGNDDVDDDLKTSLKIASIMGKYIVNMISGTCSNCGIQYSISENCLVWICPVCESFNITDKKYKIYVETANISKLSVTIKR